MKESNRDICIKAGIASILFIISIFVYVIEHRRGTELVAGSDLFVGLDVNKIYKISSYKKGKTLTLVRKKEKFYIQTEDGYPALNSKINELLYKIANITIREKLGPSKNSLLKDFDLSNGINEITLFDLKGEIITKLHIGKDYKGLGNYFRLDESSGIYISQGSLNFNPNKDFYISKQLTKIDEKEIVSLTSFRPQSSGFKIVYEKDELQLLGPRPELIDSKKLKTFVNKITKLKFDKFFKGDSKKVRDLKFSNKVHLLLKNKLIYVIKWTFIKDKFYSKISIDDQNLPDKINISRDDGETELKSVDNLIKLKDQTKKYNSTHLPWVYQLTKSDGKAIDKGAKDFYKKTKKKK